MLSLVSSSLDNIHVIDGADHGALGTVMDWQHIFVPSLPCNLLSMLDAPMPFLIGIKRYLLRKIDDGDKAFADTSDAAENVNTRSHYGNNMDGVVMVDVDSGLLEVLGSNIADRDSYSEDGRNSNSGPIVDLIGDSSNRYAYVYTAHTNIYRMTCIYLLDFTLLTHHLTRVHTHAHTQHTGHGH